VGAQWLVFLKAVGNQARAVLPSRLIQRRSVILRSQRSSVDEESLTGAQKPRSERGENRDLVNLDYPYS
jgi:hypothetical protein